MKPTLTDLARAAGVSTATVDRVVHDRPGVRGPVRAHVRAVADRIGYLLQGSEATGRRKPIRLTVLMPGVANAYLDELSRQVRVQGTALAGVAAKVVRSDGLSPEGLAEALIDHGRRADGVALIALDHPAVREAIRGLAEAGKPVVTLASDIRGVPRVAYVGVDNLRAGRLAGYVMGRFLGPGPGKVAFIAGSLAYRGHQEREIGFRQIMAERFANLELAARLEVRENRERAQRQARALLERHPDLRALYNAGGGTSGIVRALEEAGRRDIVCIAHEATPSNREALLAGTLDAVIDQNPRLEVREALTALANAAQGRRVPVIPPGLQVILRENLPTP